MSRKSKKRREREQHAEQRPAEPSEALEGSIHPLTGGLRETLEAMVSGLTLLARAPDPAEDLAESGTLLDEELVEELNQLEEALTEEFGDVAAIDDDAAELDEELYEDDSVAPEDLVAETVALTVRLLARKIIFTALGREPGGDVAGAAEAPSDDDGTAAAVLDAMVHGLLPGVVPVALRPSRAERRDALDEAAYELREVGLEEFDVDCQLVEAARDAYELSVIPLSAEHAHMALLEFLFERGETIVELDALLSAERFASSWEFTRWSASAPPGVRSVEAESFARQVREQEYSLAHRPTVALGGSVIGQLATDDSFAEMFPRQHRLAEALIASFVDVFECTAVNGSRVTLRSARTGDVYDVHEHAEPGAYASGSVSFGRLLPFGDGAFLRSPGMVFAAPGDGMLVGRAVDMFQSLCATLVPELALEGTIASIAFGVRVPREIKPMRSRAEARGMLGSLQALLEGAPKPDATLEAFMAALEEQANPRRPGAPEADPSRRRATRPGGRRPG